MAGAGGGGKTAPLRYQEPIGGDAERAMMMKSPPAAALAVSPSEFLLQFFVIWFDAPAVLGQFHQISPADSSRQCRQPILGGLRFSGGPFDQQPLFLMRFRLPVIPRRASNSDGCQPASEFLLRSFAPGDGLPIAGRQGARESISPFGIARPG